MVVNALGESEILLREDGRFKMSCWPSARYFFAYYCGTASDILVPKPCRIVSWYNTKWLPGKLASLLGWLYPVESPPLSPVLILTWSLHCAIFERGCLDGTTVSYDISGMLVWGG